MTPEQIIFQKLADEQPIYDLGGHKVKIAGKTIHWRLKGFPSKNPTKFPFNINPNSISVDFALFICGNEKNYFLIPIEIIKMMNSHSDAYPDRRNPGYTIITIDTTNTEVGYAKPSISLDLIPFKNKDSIDTQKTKVILPTQDEVTRRKYSGGESEEHLDFKNQIANDSSLIGIEKVNVIDVENDTHVFPSADRPDIIFICKDNKYVIVEIEIENCFPGAYQAIKYKSLLCAEKGFPLNADNVATMLVARKINSDVKQFCGKYGVKVIEKKR